MAIKRVPIGAARQIAEICGATGVAIFYFDDHGNVGGTSYGVTKRHCRDMAYWLDAVFDGIPHDIPAPFGEHCPWPGITQE